MGPTDSNSYLTWKLCLQNFFWLSAADFIEKFKSFPRIGIFTVMFEALKMATSNAAALNELTGPNHPYKEGPLGVIQVGAYADLIIVNGNPLISSNPSSVLPNFIFKFANFDHIYVFTLLMEPTNSSLSRY